MGTVEVVVTSATAPAQLEDLARYALQLAATLRAGQQLTPHEARTLHKLCGLAEHADVRIEHHQLLGPDPRPDVVAPTQIELHLGPDPTLVGRYGSRIKRAGGKYRACRGYQDTRFVFLPNTTEGRELANELVRAYPGRDTLSGRYREVTPVIFRGGADVGNVQYLRRNTHERIETLLEYYEKACNRAIDEGRWL